MPKFPKLDYYVQYQIDHVLISKLEDDYVWALVFSNGALVKNHNNNIPPNLAWVGKTLFLVSYVDDKIKLVLSRGVEVTLDATKYSIEDPNYEFEWFPGQQEISKLPEPPPASRTPDGPSESFDTATEAYSGS